jgi:dynein heavy chain
VAGERVVFLLSDTQVVSESFLEDVNNLLNSGEVRGLGVMEGWQGWLLAAGYVQAAPLMPVPAVWCRLGGLTHTSSRPPLGQVPGMFPPDERERIVADVREWAAKQPGSPSGKEAVWAAFINRVRDNRHVGLALSPVGEAFRARWVWGLARAASGPSHLLAG